MFRFADLGRVWVPVDLPYPVEDGEDADVRIHVLFRLLTDDELTEREGNALADAIRALQERVADRATSAAPADAADDLHDLHGRISELKATHRNEVLDRALDWRGVDDENGAPVAFTREHLDAMIAHRPILRAMRDALYTASREGPRKNSLPGSAGLPGRVQA